MTNLETAIEDYLASLPDDDWRALVYRVRPPPEVQSGMVKEAERYWERQSAQLPSFDE